MSTWDEPKLSRLAPTRKPQRCSSSRRSTELDSSETVVDGLPAWQLTEEIRIDNPDLEVEGDIAKVVVVDTGDEETYGLFVSVVPIGDQAMIDQQDAAVGKLKVR